MIGNLHVLQWVLGPIGLRDNGEAVAVPSSITCVEIGFCPGDRVVIARSPGWKGYVISWWRHQMETFYALLDLCVGNSPLAGEFPSQRPVTRSFDVFFDPRLNKRLCKQSKRRWFETPSRSLWRHCNVIHWSLAQVEVTSKLWFSSLLYIYSVIGKTSPGFRCDITVR